MKSLRATLIGALALSLLSIGAASAQTAPGGRGPVQPTDTKQFGDWMVRCYPVKSPSPCDMFELLANKKNQQRILSLSIAYVPSSDRHVIQIAVPLGVLIPKGLVMSSDAYNSPMLHYRRCDRGGCYVEMLMQNDSVNALLGATAAKITVYADGGKAFEIPFSLKGFSDAHGAMQDLARKKTQGSAPPADDTTAPAPTAPAPSGDNTPAPDQTPSP